MNIQNPNDGIGTLILRDVEENDIPTFFEQQLDSSANHMAAFTPKDTTDVDAHRARWNRLLGDDTIKKQTIVIDGIVVGHIASFEQSGKREVTYWIGKEHWGKGIATRALAEFLRQEVNRPLYARAAMDNIASLRVLEKCGFVTCGEAKGFSNARGEEVEEYVLMLSAGERSTPRN
jgi:RimJ/RimL family protein N-acetyltransferase